MRRKARLALSALFSSAAALVATASPASAHICPVPVQIPVGVPSSISVGVTVENATVTDVTIGLPVGLRLDRVHPAPGWTATRTGSTVRYRGATLAPFSCAFFPLGVTATVRGAFGVSVVQRTASGQVVARSTPDPSSPNDQALNQFVYAGVEPPAPPSTSKGPSATTIAGVALLGGGVVMLVILRVRAVRTRDRLGDDGDDDQVVVDEADREALLRARLEQFKKRTPDPPPRT